MTADRILEALKATGLPVLGVRVGDLTDPTTWTFDGPLTEVERAAAIDAVAHVVRPALSAAGFWPVPSELELDVAALKERVHVLEQEKAHA